MSGRLPPLLSAGIIVAVVGGTGAAFAYAGGWLSPDRLSGARVADAFGPKVVPGHRLNHAKGTCFTGTFVSTGAGAALSVAPMLAAGSYPALGRFNLATPDPYAKDSSVRARGMGLRIAAGGQEWRMALLDAPVFPFATPRVFYENMLAAASPDPQAMARFVAAHPGMKPFLAWAKDGERTGSYAEEPYNSLDSFRFADAAGTVRTVRWSLHPQATVTHIPAAAFDATGPDVLEREIAARVARAPARWTMTVTVAAPGDPTADPSRVWPAGRRTVTVGTLIVDRVIPEPDGPCRDVNFDPTVLPRGMATSDDPFPAARSAVYARSFARRTAHAANYPRDADPYPPALPPPSAPGKAS